MVVDSILRQFIDRPAWFDDAKCRGMDPAIFFPDRYKGVLHAKTICRECPVQAECAMYAVDSGEVHGIFGGMSERERRRLRRDTRPPLVRHGTNAGYAAHRKRGEDACQSCREAHAAYSADRRERTA